MKKYMSILILLPVLGVPHFMYAKIGGTISLKNMSYKVNFVHCRASNLIPYTASENKIKNNEVLENIFYYAELLDQQKYNRKDVFAKLWSSPYKPILKSCGIDHKQLCDHLNFYTYIDDPSLSIGRGYNELFTPNRPGKNPSLFELESVIDNYLIPLYYKGVQKRLSDNIILKKVNANLLKRHNAKSNPMGYDKFFGAISMNGVYSQSYISLWSESAQNNVYSNVECDIINPKTYDYLGIVGATINSYKYNEQDIVQITPFISGDKAKNALSISTTKKIFGNYSYAKIQVSDRITKDKEVKK